MKLVTAVTPLIEQEFALKVYLEALLSEPTEPPPAQTRAPAPMPAAPIVPANTPAAPLRPVWAATPFSSLLFRVCGLTLAVPLVELNGILPHPGEIPSLPGHAPWFLGLLPHRAKHVGVIDTALLVVPERDRSAPAGTDGRRHILLFDERCWGLTCDSVTKVVTLDPGRVRWRTAATRRPWLAGTSIEHMCALLDLQGLTALLRAGGLGRVP